MSSVFSWGWNRLGNIFLLAVLTWHRLVLYAVLCNQLTMIKCAMSFITIVVSYQLRTVPFGKNSGIFWNCITGWNFRNFANLLHSITSDLFGSLWNWWNLVELLWNQTNHNATERRRQLFIRHSLLVGHYQMWCDRLTNIYFTHDRLDSNLMYSRLFCQRSALTRSAIRYEKSSRNATTWNNTCRNKAKGKVPGKSSGTLWNFTVGMTERNNYMFVTMFLIIDFTDRVYSLYTVVKVSFRLPFIISNWWNKNDFRLRYNSTIVVCCLSCN